MEPVSLTCDISDTHHPLIFVNIQVISPVLGLRLVTVTMLRLVRILFSSSSLVRHFDDQGREIVWNSVSRNFLSLGTHPINTRHWPLARRSHTTKPGHGCCWVRYRSTNWSSSETHCGHLALHCWPTQDTVIVFTDIWNNHKKLYNNTISSQKWV